MAGMAVVTMPAIPDGWHGRDLVRIVDPLGCVAAGIAPALAGVVVGCHARLTNPGPWHPIALATASDPYFAFEPVVSIGVGAPEPLRTLGSGWRLVERDPTGAVVQGAIDEQPVRIAAACEDAGLRLSVEMSGSGAGASLAFCTPPAWKQPAGSLPLEVTEEKRGNRRHLLVDFLHD